MRDETPDAETLVIDGLYVAVVRSEGGSFRVAAGDRELGSLDLLPGGGGFTARRAGAESITRPSQWGGDVTARFQTRELAIRALLAPAGDGSGRGGA